MSCKPSICVANTVETTVATNSVIPLLTIIRRRDTGLNKFGNSVVIEECRNNYYLVTVNATVGAPAAGNVTITLQQNSTNVPGGTATETITTPVTENRSLSFTVLVRNFSGPNIDTLLLLNTGVAATFTNVVMTIVKL